MDAKIIPRLTESVDYGRISSITVNYGLNGLFVPLLVIVRHKYRGDVGSECAEESDSGSHQEHCDDAPLCRHGKFVSIAHRGDRHVSPPDGIFGRLDVTLGIGLYLEDGDRREDDEQDGEDRCGGERPLGLVLEDVGHKLFRCPESSQYP